MLKEDSNIRHGAGEPQMEVERIVTDSDEYSGGDRREATDMASS